MFDFINSNNSVNCNERKNSFILRESFAFAPFAANLYNKGDSLGAFVDEKPCSIIQIKFLLAVF